VIRKDDDEDDEAFFRQFTTNEGHPVAIDTPTTKRKKAEPFVKVPLWWITQAARLTKTPTLLVCIELLHRAWKTKSMSFPMPNGKLGGLGVGRKVKYRVLRDLERGGLITIERPAGKTLVITLVLL
jgi:hypothetical protein